MEKKEPKIKSKQASKRDRTLSTFFRWVVVGDHVLKENPDCRPRRYFCLPEPQKLPIEKVIPHPNFDSEKYWEGYDIALVRVRGNIKLYVRL